MSKDENFATMRGAGGLYSFTSMCMKSIKIVLICHHLTTWNKLYILGFFPQSIFTFFFLEDNFYSLSICFMESLIAYCLSLFVGRGNCPKLRHALKTKNRISKFQKGLTKCPWPKDSEKGQSSNPVEVLCFCNLD